MDKSQKFSKQLIALRSFLLTLNTQQQITAAIKVQAAFLVFDLDPTMDILYGRLSETSAPEAEDAELVRNQLALKFLMPKTMKLEQFGALNELILTLDQSYQLAAAGKLMSAFEECKLSHALTFVSKKFGSAKVKTDTTEFPTGYVVTVTLDK